MIYIRCRYGGSDHEFPDDWKFGGANNEDPGADPRWEVTHYTYMNSEYGYVMMISYPICDDQALDAFTQAAEIDSTVKWITAKRPKSGRFEIMPFVYVAETNTVHPYEFKEIK